MTNHNKAIIDKIRQNSKCRLYSDKDEMINHIISETSKLARNEYMTRDDRVGKGIHWELSKKSKSDHANKCYLYATQHLSWRMRCANSSGILI